jgi:hypothetical protein
LMGALDDVGCPGVPDPSHGLSVSVTWPSFTHL